MRQVFSLIVIAGLLLVAGSRSLAAVQPTVALRPSSTQAASADQYIVVLKPGRDARAVVRSLGVTPKHVYTRVLNGFAATLNAGQRTALEQHPDVALVEPDQVVEATGLQAIDLTNNSGLWGLDRIDQRQLPLDGQYLYAGTGSGVTAYIIDSGIQADHPDFGSRAQRAYDAFGETGVDCHGHGTHLAGIIGGTTYGVAKQINLRGVRVLQCDGQGLVSDAIRGIDWVATNATKPAVATIAFSPVNLTSSSSETLKIAIENLIGSGVFVAVAAGNSSTDACTISPANVPAAYTVAASTRTDARAIFSNYGSCVDGYAPGAGITSTWINSTNNTLSGTSQATAFVAGVAALYKGSYGDAAQATINAWLNTRATPNQISGNPASTPNQLLYSDLPLAISVVESFESGISNWHTYSGGGATISPSVTSPSQVGGSSMAVDYTVPAGGWIGVYRDYSPNKPDWSAYTHLDFWLYGSNSGSTIRLMIQDNDTLGSTSDSAERFVYSITDNFSGWRHLSLPWSVFTRNDWQPAGAPNDGLTLTRVQGIVFEPTSGSSSFRLDQIELVKRSSVYHVVATFENNSSAGWQTYSSSGATINPSVTSPSQVGSYGLSVAYTIPASGWVGVYRDYSSNKPDWSKYTHFDFWFYGGNSGTTIRLLLQDNDTLGSTSDSAERFVYSITDNFSGWRQFSLPWSAFTRNDWQPVGAPNDGLTLTRVQGITFEPTGGSGSFRLDQIQVRR